jgi:hypothetical protein
MALSLLFRTLLQHPEPEILSRLINLEYLLKDSQTFRMVRSLDLGMVNIR